MATNIIEVLLKFKKEGDEVFRNVATSMGELKKSLDAGGDGSAYLEGIRKQLISAGASATEATRTIKGLSDSLKTVDGSAIDKLAQGMKSVEGGVTGLTSLVKGLAAAFLGLAAVDYLKSATQAAARTEVLGIVLQQVGKNAGYSREELEKADKAVQKMGITASASRESLTQLMNAGLKISFAGPLARAAQDLAVISGMDSSQTFSRLILNIQQLDTMGLRFMGIIVDRTRAEALYAQTLGKTVSALTAKEQKEAFASAVLEEASKRTGTYEAAMEAAGKAATSLSRYQETLAVTIGNNLLPAYLELVKQFSYFLGDMNKQAEGFDKTKDSAKAFGDAVGLVLFGIRDGISILTDHTGAVVAAAAAYVGLRTAILGIAAAGGITAFITTIVAGWTAFSAAVVSAVGVVASWGVAMGAVSAQTAVAGTAMVAGIAPLVAVLGIAAAAVGLLYVAWKGWQAYGEKLEAEKSLEAFKKKAEDVYKNMPDVAKEMWERMKKDSTAYSNFEGKTAEELAALKKKMYDAIMAAQARHTVAVAAGSKATEADKKVIAEWEVAYGKALDTYGKLSRAIASAPKAYISPEDMHFAEVRAEVDALTSSFKDVLSAIKDYQSQIGKGVDTTYKLAREAIDTNYRYEVAVLDATEVYKGQNAEKKLAVDQGYYRQSSNLAEEEFRIKKGFLEANYEATSAMLKVVASQKEGDVNASKAANTELLQSNYKFTEEMKGLEQKHHDDLVRIRDAAASKYEASLRSIAALQKQLNDENLAHEVKVADLTMRLKEDSFKTREESLTAKERALQIQEDALKRSGVAYDTAQFQRQRAEIATERGRIADDRKLMEKEIEAKSQSLFLEWLDKARAAVAEGGAENLALAEEYEKIAAKYGNAAKTNAQLLENENALHSEKVTRIAASTAEAQRASRLQKEAFDAMTRAVTDSNTAIQLLANRMMELGERNHIFTLKGQFDALTSKIDEAREKMAKLSNEDPEKAKLYKGIIAMKEQQEAFKGGIEASTRAIDGLAQERKLVLDRKDVELARRALEDSEKAAKGLEGERHLKVNADVKNANADLLKAREGVAALTNKSHEVKITSDASSALTGVQDTKDRVLSLTDEVGRLRNAWAAANDLTPAQANIKVMDNMTGKVISYRQALSGIPDDLNASSGIMDILTKKVMTYGEAILAGAIKVNGLAVENGKLVQSVEKPWVISIDKTNADGQLSSLSITADAVKASIATPGTIDIIDLATGKLRDLSAVKDAVAATPGSVVMTLNDQATEGIERVASAARRVVDTPMDAVVTFTPDTSRVDVAEAVEDATVVDAMVEFDVDNRSVEWAKSWNQQTTYSNHVITVYQRNGNALGGLLEGYADGGEWRGSGLVSGPGTGTSDSIPALFSNGEFLLKTAATNFYGLDFLNGLNAMVIPPPRGYAEGGMVTGTKEFRVPSMSPISNTTSTAKNDVVDLNFNIAGKTYQAQSSRDTAKTLANALRELSRAG